MKHLIIPAVLAAAAPFAAIAQGADPNMGRNVAANCANCHGTNGASVGGMPSLAGRQAAELLQTMREFRDGKRPATIMHQLAKGYSDEQIVAIAGYFAAQKK